MIRVLNFFCFAVSALACLALYHVSDQTRATRGQVAQVAQQIAAEQQSISLLQAEWGRLSEPARIQRLSQVDAGGADDAPAVELSSLTMLPRKGEASPMEDAQLRSANVIVPVAPGSGD
jgi:cell division protein FtsL